MFESSNVSRDNDSRDNLVGIMLVSRDQVSRDNISAFSGPPVLLAFGRIPRRFSQCLVSPAFLGLATTSLV